MKEALINELDAMTTRVRQQWEESSDWNRTTYLITGCPIGSAASGARDSEENGGWVVGYEELPGTGAKATEQCVAETGDVSTRWRMKYLAIGCSCVSPNDQRLQMLSQMVEEDQVDGVVDVISRRATPTRMEESLAIKRHVRQQHNIPYIAIETDYSTSDVGSSSTRVSSLY